MNRPIPDKNGAFLTVPYMRGDEPPLLIAAAWIYARSLHAWG